MFSVAVLTSRVGRADDSSTGTEASASVHATKLSEEGFGLYKTRDYRHAAEKFLQAYTLDQDPNLLFNIARCYEALGDPEAAIEKYELFLSTPDADQQGKRRATQAVQTLRRSKSGSVQPAPAPAVSAQSLDTELAATSKSHLGAVGDGRADLAGEGLALYKARDYRRASERFLQAYAIDPDPNLLFNVARCYAALGYSAAAIDKYEVYLKAPGTDAKGREHARVAMRALRQATAEPTAPVVTAPVENSRPHREETPPGRSRVTAGWVATGLLGAGAVVTGILALQSASSLNAARRAFPGDGHDISQRASRTTVLTLSADALGIGAILMGGLSVYWTFSSSASSSELTAAIGPGGLRIAGSF